MENTVYDLQTAIQMARSRARRTARTHYLYEKNGGFFVSTKRITSAVHGYVDADSIEYSEGLPASPEPLGRQRRR